MASNVRASGGEQSLRVTRRDGNPVHIGCKCRRWGERICGYPFTSVALLMEPGLDLQTSIRPGLDILGNEIVTALKKRSRLRRNPEIYTPGLVHGHPDVSLLDYELGRIERAHAESASVSEATPIGATPNARHALAMRTATSPAAGAGAVVCSTSNVLSPR